jgi:valine dehydrogenase (NAD+)
MKPYPDLHSAVTDAMRLAEGMTYKWAMTGLSRGGGKTVIAVPPEMNPEAREGLLRRYGEMVAQLGGLFATGPDVGTNAEDMDIVAQTGASYVFGRSTKAGGSGDSGRPTALGVFQGMQVACEHCFGTPSLAGRRALVQGIGAVGRPLARHLFEAGAVVLCTDTDERPLEWARTELGATIIPSEGAFATPCDVFTPCALGGVLNAQTIPRLQCRIVAGSANNQIDTPEDADGLHAREILYAPDLVINMGGAIALITIESMGWSQEKSDQHIVESVRSALQRVFGLSEAENVSTAVAARRVAEERLRSA